ncbi:MAG: hypothetical protein DDT25_00245 [Chloroflexi bacterium]|nr:hypothetical protein [Chloroflexota bacterium]
MEHGTDKKNVYVIYRGKRDERPRVMQAYEHWIIQWAEDELSRSNDSLESMAGVDFIENDDGNIVAARQLTDEEILAFSIERLGDDGRMFITFRTDSAGADDFICTSKHYGLEDEAAALVKKGF